MNPVSRASKFKLKPIGLFDRLLSSLLVALLTLGQPAAVVRVMR